jgi:Arc/MetJ-type ribon-helix-helix transcriptional regulator
MDPAEQGVDRCLGVDLSDVVLPEDHQQALISEVESGQFPSEAAMIEKALRSLLAEERAREAPDDDRAAEPRPKRERFGLLGTTTR